MGISETVAELEKRRKRLRVLSSVRVILKFLFIVAIVASLLVIVATVVLAVKYGAGALEEAEVAKIDMVREKYDWIFWLIDFVDPFALISISIFVELLILIFYAGQWKLFQKQYKDTFIKPIIESVFDDCTYLWDSGFNIDWVREFPLVKQGNHITSEDYLSGDYRGVRFEQAEVAIKNQTGGGCLVLFMVFISMMSVLKNYLAADQTGKKTKPGSKKKGMRTYFCGQMLTFSFPKLNMGSLYVFSKNFTYRTELSKNAQRQQMEGVDFNEKFEVFAADAHEAFYILTPQLQERMKELFDRYESIAFYFLGNHLYLGINNTQDRFDADIKKPISYPEEKERINRDFGVIKDLIDAMLVRQSEETT